MDTPEPTHVPEPTKQQNPTPPFDLNAIKQLAQEHLDRERYYLSFVQDQAAKDREYFKYLFKYAVWFLGALIAAGTFFLWRSVDRIEEQAKTEVAQSVSTSKAEVTAAVERLKSLTAQELDAVRAEVRSRVANEFETEQITSLVRDVARDRSEREFQQIIRVETAAQVAKGIKDEAPSIRLTVQSETKRAVSELQPMISEIVGGEVRGQVEKSVDPIESKLKEYGDNILIGNLATLARSDDRHSFDQLILVARGVRVASQVEKRIAHNTVTAIIREKQSGLRLSYSFKEEQSPESMKKFLLTSAYPNDRMAAIDNYPAEDHSILPLLVQVIMSDQSIDVVNAAFIKFSAITKQKFEFPDYNGLQKWWNENQEKFR